MDNAWHELIPGHVEIALMSQVVEVPAISCIYGRTHNQSSQQQCQRQSPRSAADLPKVPLQTFVLGSLEPLWKVRWRDGSEARLAVELLRDRFVALRHLVVIHAVRNLVLLVAREGLLVKVQKVSLLVVKQIAGLFLVVRRWKIVAQAKCRHVKHLELPGC